MRRILFLVFLIAIPVLGGCGTPRQDSNVEVRTTGDAQVYGVYSRHFTAPGRP
ncbi:hypothetical protein [Solidesulfovibrio sp.]|uniref:hypothetical protein n=1 Tax=Solidesulfovibrio sp. TaxID=2910990 RepID=UPI0026086B58|nr:hypothetical protein [Solidesulfovibrio sp.]